LRDKASERMSVREDRGPSVHSLLPTQTRAFVRSLQ
jgi:hypothetical protein